jgi:transposase
MKDYTLSKEQIVTPENLHRTLRDKRQADRVKAVIALSKGWSAAQVAEILLFDEKTSRHYFERYQQGGLPALMDDNYPGAEPKLNEHQISELNAYIEEHIFPDAKSVVDHIRKLYGVHCSVSGVTDLLHHLGFSYIDLFAKIEAKHPDANVIYIIVDNARYYRSRLLNKALKGTKVKLIFLPPYSPNLNLIERYWKFFKKKVQKIAIMKRLMSSSRSATVFS